MPNADQETNVILEDKRVKDLSEAIHLLNVASNLVEEIYAGSCGSFNINIHEALCWVKQKRATRITEIIDEVLEKNGMS